MFKTILIGIGVALLVSALLITAVYLKDIRQAYERVQQKSTVISSPYGDIEYT